VKKSSLPVCIVLCICSQLDAQSIIAPELTSPSITIDGMVDGSEWDTASDFTSIDSIVSGSANISGINDYSADFKVAWDSDNLYVLFQVTDDARWSDSSDGTASINDSYQDDSVELYFDVNNSGSGGLGTANGNYQFRFSLDTSEIEYYPADNEPQGSIFYANNDSTNYVLETAIPWSTLGISSVTLGTTIGFDVAVNDDDDGAARDTQAYWTATSGDAWDDASYWGELSLGAASAVPEPRTYALLAGLSACCLFVFRRFRHRQ